MSTSRSHLLYCVPVEGTVTALGYFQASLAVVGVLTAFKRILVSVYYHMNDTSNHFYHTEYDLICIRINFLWLVLLGLFGSLAVFLLVGLKKRRPAYVLAYLASGVLGALAGTVYWLVILSTEPHNFIDNYVIETFLVLCAYWPCLCLVYIAYCNIKLGNDHDDTKSAVRRLSCNAKTYT